MPCCEGEFADDPDEERRNLLPSDEAMDEDFIDDLDSDAEEPDDAEPGDDQNDNWEDPEYPGPASGPGGQFRLF